MMLRRTALARKGSLRRITPMPRARQAIARRAAKTIARQRDTGPDAKTRLLILDRAEGCCEICGTQLHDGAGWIAVHSVHHRQPRKSGGSNRTEINLPSNLLLLCGSGISGCHGWIESHRSESIANGWLVPMGESPAKTPVFDLATTETSVLLTDHGTYEEIS